MRVLCSDWPEVSHVPSPGPAGGVSSTRAGWVENEEGVAPQRKLREQGWLRHTQVQDLALDSSQWGDLTSDPGGGSVVIYTLRPAQGLRILGPASLIEAEAIETRPMV